MRNLPKSTYYTPCENNKRASVGWSARIIFMTLVLAAHVKTTAAAAAQLMMEEDCALISLSCQMVLGSSRSLILISPK